VHEQLSSLFQASSTLHLGFDREPELVREFLRERAIGVILAARSQLVGQANAVDWPVILVYLV